MRAEKLGVWSVHDAIALPIVTAPELGVGHDLGVQVVIILVAWKVTLILTVFINHRHIEFSSVRLGVANRRVPVCLPTYLRF